MEEQQTPAVDGLVPFEFLRSADSDKPFVVSNTMGGAKTFEAGKVYWVSDEMWKAARERYPFIVQFAQSAYDEKVGAPPPVQAAQVAPPAPTMTDDDKVEVLSDAILEVMELADDNGPEGLMGDNGRPTTDALQQRGVDFEYTNQLFGRALKKARAEYKKRLAETQPTADTPAE